MVKIPNGSFSRIRNPRKERSGRDFEFSGLGFLAMLAPTIGALAIEGGAGAVGAVTAVVLAAAVYSLWPQWRALPAALVVMSVTVGGLAGYIGLGPGGPLTVGALLMAWLVGPMVQVVQHWDKVVVLRLGRFRRAYGPGLFILLPIIDRCAAFVDTRIRVTDFSAEKILTRDTVPVHVDALAFWMIWDAQRAILEVENFLEAVTLSAQTALRDSVGKYTLTTLLTERETLYREIQTILDAKTNPWGITILSVEFTDIVLPQELEDVMSKQAQAEREKAARILLGEAEREVAAKFREAAAEYEGHPEALHLRAMNMVYEGMKARGSMVLLPSSALESMNVGSVLGLRAGADKLTTESTHTSTEAQP